jgi:hypothetical protein
LNFFSLAVSGEGVVSFLTRRSDLPFSAKNIVITYRVISSYSNSSFLYLANIPRGISVKYFISRNSNS